MAYVLNKADGDKARDTGWLYIADDEDWIQITDDETTDEVEVITGGGADPVNPPAENPPFPMP